MKETPSDPISLPRSGVVLVGCVKQKRSIPCLAKDLYSSPLWRKRRAYAEHSGGPWMILSAKYGLVDPTQELAPYDLTLHELTSNERQAWGLNYVRELKVRLASLR